jgi:predicted lipoprotein with Yx(FWY)xxD motif
MQLKKLGALSATVLVVLAAGCSSSGTSASPSASSAPSSAASSASSPSASASASSSTSASSSASGDLAVASTKLGKIIVDSKGMTAYYFTKDQANSGKSVCSGPCLVAWPSISATSDTPKGTGITAKLGTITRDDGSKQVTVNGMPIYLWQKDKAPGDVTGQGVNKVWYVVAPDGKMITTAP